MQARSAAACVRGGAGRGRWRGQRRRPPTIPRCWAAHVVRPADGPVDAAVVFQSTQAFHGWRPRHGRFRETRRAPTPDRQVHSARHSPPGTVPPSQRRPTVPPWSMPQPGRRTRPPEAARARSDAMSCPHRPPSRVRRTGRRMALAPQPGPFRLLAQTWAPAGIPRWSGHVVAHFVKRGAGRSRYVGT